MINTKNELIYLFLNLKSFVNFKIKSLFYYIFFGHLIKYFSIKNYFENNDKIKIHLGANKNISNFLNSQILGKIPIDIVKKLPFKNQSVDVIFSTHVIEHIHRRQIEFFLRESFRVLQNGGVNIICTPSIKKIVHAIYFNDNIEKKEILFQRQDKWHKDDIKTSCHQINISMRNFGHRFLVDDEYMQWLSNKIGFKSLEVVSINDVPDDDVKRYLLEDKNILWDTESDIYILTK